jgi:hypothetical protein
MPSAGISARPVPAPPAVHIPKFILTFLLTTPAPAPRIAPPTGCRSQRGVFAMPDADLVPSTAAPASPAPQVPSPIFPAFSKAVTKYYESLHTGNPCAACSHPFRRPMPPNRTAHFSKLPKPSHISRFTPLQLGYTRSTQHETRSGAASAARPHSSISPHRGACPTLYAVILKRRAVPHPTDTTTAHPNPPSCADRAPPPGQTRRRAMGGGWPSSP